MQHRRRICAALVVALTVALGRSAAAQGTIKSPGDHPDYAFEAEPHLALSYGAGFGPGFRGTFHILDRAFIPTLNDSIGVGVGADWLFYGSRCDGPANARICDTDHDVVVPIVLQWNFWVAKVFSAFGEPGVALHFQNGHDRHFVVDPFTIFVGGRLHFSNSVSLTLRFGSPEFFHHDSVFSIGVSFFL